MFVAIGNGDGGLLGIRTLDVALMISSVIITITLFKQAEIAANLYFILLSLKGWLNKKKSNMGTLPWAERNC